MVVAWSAPQRDHPDGIRGTARVAGAGEEHLPRPPTDGIVVEEQMVQLPAPGRELLHGVHLEAGPPGLASTSLAVTGAVTGAVIGAVVPPRREICRHPLPHSPGKLPGPLGGCLVVGAHPQPFGEEGADHVHGGVEPVPVRAPHVAAPPVVQVQPPLRRRRGIPGPPRRLRLGAEGCHRIPHGPAAVLASAASSSSSSSSAHPLHHPGDVPPPRLALPGKPPPRLHVLVQGGHPRLRPGKGRRGAGPGHVTGRAAVVAPPPDSRAAEGGPGGLLHFACFWVGSGRRLWGGRAIYGDDMKIRLYYTVLCRTGTGHGTGARGRTPGRYCVF